MSRKTQRYSKEFKAEAVRTVLENQLSISEGASRLSLPEGTLGQWVTAARKGLGTPGCQRRMKKWLFRNLGGDFHASGLITLCLSSSNPARPYIWRFSIFRRFT